MRINTFCKIGIMLLIILFFQDNINIAEATESYSLFTTPCARKIGDIITVFISESSLASQSAQTNMGKSDTTAGQISSFFAETQKITLPAWEWNHENDYQGTGSTQRRGTIVAKVTAQIVEILPNGNFRIQGKRTIKINEEEQIISIEGIIRPLDITRNNTVYSTYIADAQIKYEGKGVIKDNQRPGILSQILSWLHIF